MTLFQAFGQFAGQAAAAPGLSPAMVLLNPTSITYSGSSATKSADGGMEFTSISSLSVNGVFTADYDTYLLVGNTSVTGNGLIFARLRASGTDATGSDWDNQYLIVNGALLSSARDLNQSAGAWCQDGSSANKNGHITWFFSPFLTKPTAYYTHMVNRRTTMRLLEVGGVHDVSASYDGFTYYHASETFTGNLAVYGVKS